MNQYRMKTIIVEIISRMLQEKCETLVLLEEMIAEFAKKEKRDI